MKTKTFKPVVIFASMAALVSGICSCQKSSVQINVIVRDMLELEGLAGSQIKSLAEYQDFQFNVLSVVIEDEDIDAYINELLESAYEPGEVTVEAEEQYICALFEQEEMSGVRDEIKNILLYEKENEFFVTEQNRFFKFMSERSTFVLDEDELIQYAADQSVYYINLAFMNGMSLREYIAYSGQEEDAFYDALYRDAEADVKRYLIVGALSAMYGIEVTDAEFDEKCEEYGYTKEQLEKEDALGIYVRYFLLEEKVFKYCGNFS